MTDRWEVMKVLFGNVIPEEWEPFAVQEDFVWCRRRVDETRPLRMSALSSEDRTRVRDLISAGYERPGL